MNKRTSQTILLSMVIVGVFILAFMFANRWRSSRTITCDDGKRETIDLNDFVTRYSGYSVEFRAEIENKGKFEGKLSPVQLQQLSESLQSANEFRKTLVAGYNSCAISKSRFDKYLSRFQVLDGLARQIDSAASRGDLDDAARKQLQSLAEQYVAVSQTIASD